MTRRIEILQAYAARQETALKDVHWFEKYIRPEFYLQRAADDLIYLIKNRIALVKQDRPRFATDKAIMANVIRNKRIGRGDEPLRTPIVVHWGGKLIEFTHVKRAA